tara:strand:- start:1137 stop:1481 length:345 start_codon:yes stop_codon:yes gene_type:complete
MKWPPVKAWTSKTFINGYKHFVAINYGGKGNSRWLNLVSVLDGNVSIKVFWQEINDSSKWSVGWSEEKEEANNRGDSAVKDGNQFSVYSRSCLHPSLDSGFNIPIRVKSVRNWT